MSKPKSAVYEITVRVRVTAAPDALDEAARDGARAISARVWAWSARFGNYRHERSGTWARVRRVRRKR